MAAAPEFVAPDPIAPDADPEAPYGRKADGTPKAKPGRPAGRKTGTGGTTTSPKPPRSSTPRRTASKAKPDYRQGVAGLFQLAAAPLAIAGQRNPAFLADSATLAAFAEPMANGLQQVADEDPRVAAVLDRILRVGPYAAVIAPLIGMTAQFAVNHGVVPVAAAASLGVMHPDDLIERVTGVRPAESTPVPE